MKKSTVQALLVMIGLPISFLLLCLGSSPQNVDGRNSTLWLAMYLLLLVLVTFIVKSYFKTKQLPATRGVIVGVLVGISLIIIPTTILLRSLAFQSHGRYATCINDYGQQLERRCRENERVLTTSLYLNGGLEPGLVAFAMLYGVVIVAVLGQQKRN